MLKNPNPSKVAEDTDDEFEMESAEEGSWKF